jgi:hypothetical protein
MRVDVKDNIADFRDEVPAHRIHTDLLLFIKLKRFDFALIRSEQH